MSEKNFDLSPGEKKEDPNQYRETCLRFFKENQRYYTENNHFRGEILEAEDKTISPESRQTLEQVKAFYERKGDSYNLLRWHEKMGHKKESYELAEALWKTGNPLFQAQAAREIWSKYRDPKWRERAITAFGIRATAAEENNDHLIKAISFHEIYRLNRKDKKAQEQAISSFRNFVEERKGKGDSWWQAIGLREIAKISGTEEDFQVALKEMEREIERATKANDFKNAGLWARDIARMRPSAENTERASQLFRQQINESKKVGDTRTVAKSYWEMWKVTKDEEHRLKALEYYQKLLAEAEKEDNKERIDECNRVLLFITK